MTDVFGGVVDARSFEIAETQTLLQEVTLPSHIWRRHGLPGRPDGSRACLGDMLHKPEVTLEQVPVLVPSQVLLLFVAASACCQCGQLLLLQLGQLLSPVFAAGWPSYYCCQLGQVLPEILGS